MSTVLLIEDDQLLIKMYETKFKSEGFNVLTAEDGEMGFDVATTQKPDIILLDMMMPKMSGTEVLAKLKATEATKNIPVIMFSNLSQEDESKKVLDMGAKEYLVKANFTPSEVVAKVKQHLQV